MLEKLKQKLEKLACDGWELTGREIHRWEFYFIGHKLDQNRTVKIRETQVRVYKKSDDGAFLGSAEDVISPTASDSEIDRKLEKLLFQASLVRNPVYTLTDRPLTAASVTDPVDVAGIAHDCIRALAEVSETPEASVNSYEIFVSGITRHTLNSNGVEYLCTFPQTEIEVVVNARDKASEIEMHQICNSGTCDQEGLKNDIGRLMAFGRDRLKAQPTPRVGQADVLLSTSDAVAVYDYFSTRMQTDLIVRKFSDYKIGEPVAAGIRGDKVSIETVLSLPNSSMNFPVDRENNAVRECYLIRDGIAKHYCGSRQFSQYLGLEESFLPTNLKVSGGSQTEAALREKDHLEIVEFSDFQVDPMSGDIAGEIRLGYWHHDGKVSIVTGGSVSGSMNDAVKNMYFSEETVQYDHWVIPKVTLLSGLRITGAGEAV